MQGSGLAQALLAPASSRARRSWVPPLLGLALGLPAIGHSRVLDDHVLERAASGAGELIPRASGLDLFQFASGDPARNLEHFGEGAGSADYPVGIRRATFGYRPRGPGARDRVLDDEVIVHVERT